MEPAFRRGDILFLNNQDNPIRVGEVVVFKIKDRDIPIVHRVMKVHEKSVAPSHPSSLRISTLRIPIPTSTSTSSTSTMGC